MLTDQSQIQFTIVNKPKFNLFFRVVFFTSYVTVEMDFRIIGFFNFNAHNFAMCSSNTHEKTHTWNKQKKIFNPPFFKGQFLSLKSYWLFTVKFICFFFCASVRAVSQTILSSFIQSLNKDYLLL